MKSKVLNTNNYGSYIYSTKLKTFLDEMLHFNKLDKRRKDLENAEVKGLSKEEKKAYNDTIKEIENINKRDLDRMKRYNLDKHIFRSMANLILFFEYLKKYPELRKTFEDDVKELFGFIRDPRKTIKEVNDSPFHVNESIYRAKNNILERFLGSLLYCDLRKDPNNFRLELIEEVFSIFRKYLFYISSIEADLAKMPHNVINSIDLIGYLTKLYSKNYEKSGNKDRDLDEISNRSIAFDRLD